MYPNVITKKIQMPDGQEISIETGKLAKLADGSVVVQTGQTMLLATVVSGKEPREGVNFLPLSVDYQEKFAAAGKIPGGFLKREGRLSDYEILISRLVDRAIRPLFPKDYRCETQVLLTLMSVDPEGLPDCLAALAASAALSVSDVPFDGPISEVRVVLHEGEYLVNPSRQIVAKADLNLIVAATEENIMMVEGEMNEVSETEMLEAMRVAHEAIKVQCQAQKELRQTVGATVREIAETEEDEELLKEVEDKLYQPLYDVFKQGIPGKAERKDALTAVKDQFVESYGEPETEEAKEHLSKVKALIGKVEKKAARTHTLDEKVRIDGRQLDQVRPIWSEVDYLPSAHGSAVFTRGETQAIATATLGTKLDEQMVDGAIYQGYKKFILHYNFPPFSTGETKPMRGPARREVGHGNLAFRALSQVLPSDEENPYTIRVVSDVLESNGSSSMATVCAGCLAMMDAGIPIRKPVSGIAMGMISDAETGKFAILSDILGDEDHLGDMDFKVTGTADGITACQMDIKIDGLAYEVLEQALEQARQGRMHILAEMAKSLDAPRGDMKPHAPRSVKIEIPTDQIGAVIGPGGKIVQEIQRTTNTTVVIEEMPKHGLVSIFATNKDDLDAAMKRVEDITAIPEVGTVYDGIVKGIKPFGAFVEFLPGKEGLLHISEISWERIESMEDVIEQGEEVKVKLIESDPRAGTFRLSRKVLLPKPEGWTPPPPRENGGDRRRGGGRPFRGGGGKRGGGRGGRDDY